MATTYAVDLRVRNAGPAAHVEQALIRAMARDGELEAEKRPVVEDVSQDLLDVLLLVDAEDSSIAEIAARDLVRDALGGHDVVVREPGADGPREKTSRAGRVEIEQVAVRASS